MFSAKQYVVRPARIRIRETRIKHAQVERLEGRRLLASHVWTGAVSGNWSDAGNWQGGVPQVGESDLVIEFPANAPRTTVVNDVGDLTVQRLVIGQGSYTLRGQAFSLAGQVEAALEKGSHRIENPVRLVGDTRLDVSGASSTDNLSLIFAGVISGSGSITKFGHNVRFAANNTYTGATVVEGGRLGVDGQQPQSNITVQSGILSGDGRVGSVTFGNAFGSMGDAIQPTLGLLFDGLPVVQGNLTLSNQTFFRPNLGHPNGALAVNGTVALNNAKLAGAYELPPGAGSAITLVNNDGTDAVVGTFDGVPEGGTVRVLDKDVVISYRGGDGNDVVATVAGQTLATRVQLAPSATVVLPGQGVTLGVTVATANPTGVTPSGTVVLFQDDKQIGTATLDAAGKASFNLTTLPARGSSRFHVTYSGDPARDLEAVRSDDVRVRVVLQGQTETKVFVNPSSANAGVSSELIARVTGLGIPEGQPTGTISFYINDVLVGTETVDAEGRVTMNTDAFPIGNAIVKAVYSGDANFTTSADESGRFTRLVDGRYWPTSLSITQAPAISNQGQPLTLTATVEAIPGGASSAFAGTVTFYAGGAAIGSAGVSPAGRAVLTVDTLGVGDHAITASFSGDDVYYTSQTTAAVTHKVTPAPQIQPLNEGATLVAAGDIDGDGNQDLVWRDDSNGRNTVQFLDGQAKVIRTADLLSMVDARWKLEAAGDFNGDGKGELVWRNSETGRVLVWKVSADKVVGIQPVAGARVAAGWRIIGTGDFNADGNADLAWRNDQNGKAVVWTMRGHGVRGVTGLGPVARNLQWSIETVHDVNGDDKPDLVWRNKATGANAVWLMNGTSFTAFKPLGRLEGNEWTIATVKDLDGDGADDILFRNTTSGEMRTWAVDRSTL